MKPQILIGSPVPDSGKTTLTLGLLRVMQRIGLNVQPFKCGSDYVDASYHAVACGKTSVNLDSWMASVPHVQYLYNKYADQADVCLVDGNQGLFDGYNKMAGSSAEMARLLNIPVIMVVNAKGMGYSVAPILCGFKRFHHSIRIVGVIYDQVISPAHYSMLKEACIDSGIECLGYLPFDEELRLPNRHSVLTAEMREHLNKTINQTANLIEKHINVRKMLDMCVCSFPCLYKLPYRSSDIEAPLMLTPFHRKIDIAVARDSAFYFLNRENLNRLSEVGRVSYFSPIYGSNFPKADFVYIPGGYPELFARQLHRRKRFLQQLKDFAENGGFLLAEGAGGALISETLSSKPEGVAYEMSGILPFEFTGLPKPLVGYKKIVQGNVEYCGFESRYVSCNGTFLLHRYKNVIVSLPHLYWGERNLFKLWN